jgi:L-lactate dehydrogenase complex protein LldG
MHAAHRLNCCHNRQGIRLNSLLHITEPTKVNMDTSAARQAILKRIRAAHGRPAETTQAERDAVHDYLQRHPEGPRPALGADLVAHFKTQALRMSDTVEQVDAMTDVPAAVARYLTDIGVAPAAIAWQTLSAIEWEAAGLAVEFRPPVNEDLVGITGCFCAIAETGTLLLLSGRESFASAALLPETHIAIVPAARIVAAMEDAFALARAEHGELPRATNFISGPSRTGDIEQTIVLGAHGPYRVHVVIVGAGAALA